MSTLKLGRIVALAMELRRKRCRIATAITQPAVGRNHASFANFLEEVAAIWTGWAMSALSPDAGAGRRLPGNGEAGRRRLQLRNRRRRHISRGWPCPDSWSGWRTWCCSAYRAPPRSASRWPLDSPRHQRAEEYVRRRGLVMTLEAAQRAV